VWQPTFVRGLQLTVDYYKIKLKDAVSNPSETDILEDCYDPARNPGFVFNAACAQVLRNPNNGTFNGSAAPGVVLPLSNLGKFDTKGWDIAVSYNLPLRNLGLNPALGRLDISFNGNIVDSWKFQATPRSVNRECVGFYSIACGSNGPSPNPKYKWSQRTAWTMGDLTLSYNWRHIDEVDEEPGGANFLPRFARIRAYDYVDLAATYNLNKNVRLAFSVANVANQKPPVVGNTIGQTSQNSGNTFPQTYDVVGRFFTLGATIKF
jgi:outer membrane receptor protein involved in Fe transport